MRKNRVLIIDHDLQTCKEIKYSLSSATIEAYYAQNVHDGLKELGQKEYETVVLDVSFSQTDGLEILRTMRKMDTVPILVLSSTRDVTHKVTALRHGADDFLVKPFHTEECLARVDAMLRRYTLLNHKSRHLFALASYDDLVVDKEHRMAVLNGNVLRLLRREFDLLSLLAFNPGKVFTFEQLYEILWHDPCFADSKNSVVCEIKRLRRKLGGADHIETVRQVGYRFKSG